MSMYTISNSVLEPLSMQERDIYILSTGESKPVGTETGPSDPPEDPPRQT